MADSLGRRGAGAPPQIYGIEEGLFRNLQAAGSRVGRDVQIPAFVYCRTVLGTCPCVTLVVAKVLEEWGFFIYLFFVA